jgi:hypothetical protein
MARQNPTSASTIHQQRPAGAAGQRYAATSMTSGQRRANGPRPTARATRVRGDGNSTVEPTAKPPSRPGHRGRDHKGSTGQHGEGWYKDGVGIRLGERKLWPCGRAEREQDGKGHAAEQCHFHDRSKPHCTSGLPRHRKVADATPPAGRGEPGPARSCGTARQALHTSVKQTPTGPTQLG